MFAYGFFDKIFSKKIFLEKCFSKTIRINSFASVSVIIITIAIIIIIIIIIIQRLVQAQCLGRPWGGGPPVSKKSLGGHREEPR